MPLVRSSILGLVAALLTAAVCLGEDAETSKFYKLDFVVKEVQAGKVVNSRSYSSMTTGGSRASIRAGSKVPVAISQTATTQYQIFDVGVNIDVTNAKETPGGLSLFVNADVASLAEDPSTTPRQPIVRQNKWSSTVVVPVRKPVVIFSSDDVSSKNQYQLELTAVPIS